MHGIDSYDLNTIEWNRDIWLWAWFDQTNRERRFGTGSFGFGSRQNPKEGDLASGGECGKGRYGFGRGLIGRTVSSKQRFATHFIPMIAIDFIDCRAFNKRMLLNVAKNGAKCCILLRSGKRNHEGWEVMQKSYGRVLTKGLRTLWLRHSFLELSHYSEFMFCYVPVCLSPTVSVDCSTPFRPWICESDNGALFCSDPLNRIAR